MATMQQALALVDALEKQLVSRRDDIATANRYYRGEQRLAYASEQFNRFFAERFNGFADNWCGVVADSLAERLAVTGIRPDGVDTPPDADLWRVWNTRSLDADSSIGFVDAVIARRSFALVWGNPDDETTPEVTFEHPSQAIVAYEAGSRRRRKAALKLWSDGEFDLATLYLANVVWKFRRRRAAGGVQLPPGVSGGRGWEPRRPSEDRAWPLPNPMGVVPMVELPNRPFLVGEPLSEISGVIAMQNAVNLLWAYLFTTADFASFPQRIVLGAEVPKTPILDDNGQVIGERPVDLAKFAVDRVLWIEGKDAKVANWPAAQLDVYTNVIEVQVGHIAAQTRTPQHYLVGKMANLSADALKAAETGLVSKAAERQVYFGEAVRELFRLIALAQGQPEKARAVAAGTVLWKDPESRSEAQLVDALQKLKDIGFPFEFLAARYGLTPTEIATVVAQRDKAAERILAGDIEALFGAKPGAEQQPPTGAPEAA